MPLSREGGERLPASGGQSSASDRPLFQPTFGGWGEMRRCRPLGGLGDAAGCPSLPRYRNLAETFDCVERLVFLVLFDAFRMNPAAKSRNRETLVNGLTHCSSLFVVLRVFHLYQSNHVLMRLFSVHFESFPEEDEMDEKRRMRNGKKGCFCVGNRRSVIDIQTDYHSE